MYEKYEGIFVPVFKSPVMHVPFCPENLIVGWNF